MLIVLCATSGKIIYFASVIGASAGIASASFILIFSLTTGIIKKLLSSTRNKKKSVIRLLCWLKVDSRALTLYYLRH